ncbi:MAG: imelysin family protein [Pseudomonadota bacterium]
MVRVLLSCLLSLLLVSAPKAQDWTIANAVDAVITEAIVPSLAEYGVRTQSTASAVSALCTTPTQQNLDQARQSFAALVEAWGQVEFFRLGPLTAENRLERTLYWPDRKGRGLRQVQGMIGNETPIVTDPAEIGGQSVAVQGLLALEFVLFGTASDELATQAGHQCAYASAITQNLNTIADELIAGWQDENGIAKLWLNPSDDNPLFRDESEQLKALLKVIEDGTEIMRVQRLDPFLDSEPFNHKRALFWRSGLTFASLEGNVIGLQRVTTAARLAETVSGDDARVIDGMRFEWGNAMRVLEQTQIPVDILASDSEALGRVKYLRIVTQSIYDLSGSRIPAIFGLTAGFSSLDGD